MLRMMCIWWMQVPELEKLIVEVYVPPDPGHIPEISLERTLLDSLPLRLELSSLVYSQGYMVVGPPGTGKTDTAVQILNVLYHNCPSQRRLIITHSNQALNDLFEKIIQAE